MADETFIASACRQIEKYRCISFDVFDTLLSRDCEHPADVFDLVEERYNQMQGTKVLSGFSQMRKQAEAACYKAGQLPTLDQIYDRIALNDSSRSVLKEIEQGMEAAICCRKQTGYRLYQFARNNGKRIIAISDMYLSSGFIREMLCKAGYEIDDIYVSCEYGADKTHGGLFKTALREAGVKNEEVLHFGDRFTADIMGARIAGIKALRVPGERETAYLKSGKDEFVNRYLRKFVSNRCAAENNRVSALGYEVFGPMIFGFCQWLHEYIQRGQFNRVLFCARDMLQTYQIYSQMYPEEHNRICYFYVSVKSLELPYKAATGADNSKEAVEQLQLLREYLKQAGCNRGSIAIVDSGFSGRSQKMLTAILKGQCEVHGLYMRVNKTFRSNIQDRESFAYLFDGNPNTGYYIGAAFFETMIAATHGRTTAYQRDANGSVVPVLGTANPNAPLLEEFQKGINRFAADYKTSPFCEHRIKAGSVQDSYLNFCFCPREADVHALETIMGGDDTYDKIIVRRERRYYLKHPLRFFTDLRKTSWKGGFLFHCCGIFAPATGNLYLKAGNLFLMIAGESKTLTEI